MKRVKQVLAVLGIVIIAALYITTLILAVMGGESTKQLFIASIVATVVVPCVMYIINWVFRLMQERSSGPKNK